METLDNEICEHISKYLPWRQVIQNRIVSKQWFTLFSPRVTNIIIKKKSQNQEFFGYIIETTLGNLECLMSNESQCCEQAYSDENGIANLIGEHLVSVKFPFFYSKMKCFSETSKVNRLGDDSNHRYFVEIKSQKRTCYIVFGNIHNGYYARYVVTNFANQQIDSSNI